MRTWCVFVVILQMTITDLYLQIMYVEVDLDNTKGNDGAGNNDDWEDDDGDDDAATRAMEAFFDDHPTTKMLFALDTHSVENGFFAWTRGDGKQVEACRLYEVGFASVW